MKKKSGGGEGGGANWMDTYGDMVTLLLCFFMLLYSISTIDENKWKAMVQSFNPNARPTQTEIIDGNQNGPFADPNENEGGVTDPDEADKAESEQAEIDAAIDQLYEMMKQYVEESGKNIEITKGDNGVFLSFQNAVFFDGDSWEIRPDGKEVLDALAPMIDKAAPYIDLIEILGHTAQANDEHANDVDFDWTLSSMRAAKVTAYLHEHVSLDPGRLQSAGFGQHRPVAENDTEENMRKNRRVEMIVTGKNLMDELGDALEQYTTVRTEGPSKNTPAESAAPDAGDSSQAGGGDGSAGTDSSGSQADGGEDAGASGTTSSD